MARKPLSIGFEEIAADKIQRVQRVEAPEGSADGAEEISAADGDIDA
ncbi:MAG: hypothetical protein R2715_09670 [Ilumatobacteraceae bacterium]